LSETPPQRVRVEILRHANDLIKALTEDPEAPKPIRTAADGLIRYEGGDVVDVLRNVNRDFLDRGWGDGFPVIPPTPGLVEEMLRGTSRSRDEVITIMEPGRGIGTVENIAVNCVMAGCLPEHLPVVITAIEAMSEPAFDLSEISQSTGPQTPLVVVNGPIRKELGINFGRCALGPGAPSRVNTAIGRAVRLIMMNIGHAYAGVMDNDTIGSPNKYSMCMGENEEANPWEPLHVELGFSKDESTVTVFPCGSHVDVPDLVSITPEGVLTTFAYTANAPLSPSWAWLRPDEIVKKPLIVLSPDHARIIADAGWTKNDIRHFMFYNSRLPLRVLKTPMRPASIAPGWKWLLERDAETMVPVVRDPSDYQIVVVGGPAGKSAYIWNWAAPVTKRIRR
jgi:hypothetical protein